MTISETQQLKAKSIFVVDDHPLVRAALVHLIQKSQDLKVVGEHNGEAGVEDIILNCQPDLVLLDLNLKGQDGLDVLKKLKAKRPELKVLVISMHEQGAYVTSAMKLGASGYLLKSTDTELIPLAVQTILHGGTFLSASLRSALEGGEAHEDLTPREIEVVRGVVQGLAAKEIAEILGISYRTVEVHRSNAMRKLNARNIAELTRLAMSRGMDQPLKR